MSKTATPSSAESALDLPPAPEWAAKSKTAVFTDDDGRPTDVIWKSRTRKVAGMTFEVVRTDTVNRRGQWVTDPNEPVTVYLDDSDRGLVRAQALELAAALTEAAAFPDLESSR